MRSSTRSRLVAGLGILILMGATAIAFLLACDTRSQPLRRPAIESAERDHERPTKSDLALPGRRRDTDRRDRDRPPLRESDSRAGEHRRLQLTCLDTVTQAGIPGVRVDVDESGAPWNLDGESRLMTDSQGIALLVFEGPARASPLPLSFVVEGYSVCDEQVMSNADAATVLFYPHSIFWVQVSSEETQEAIAGARLRIAAVAADSPSFDWEGAEPACLQGHIPESIVYSDGAGGARFEVVSDFRYFLSVMADGYLRQGSMVIRASQGTVEVRLRKGRALSIRAGVPLPLDSYCRLRMDNLEYFGLRKAADGLGFEVAEIPGGAVQLIVDVGSPYCKEFLTVDNLVSDLVGLSPRAVGSEIVVVLGETIYQSQACLDYEGFGAVEDMTCAGHKGDSISFVRLPAGIYTLELRDHSGRQIEGSTTQRIELGEGVIERVTVP